MNRAVAIFSVHANTSPTSLSIHLGKMEYGQQLPLSETRELSSGGPSKNMEFDDEKTVEICFAFTQCEKMMIISGHLERSHQRAEARLF